MDRMKARHILGVGLRLRRHFDQLKTLTLAAVVDLETPVGEIRVAPIKAGLKLRLSARRGVKQSEYFILVDGPKTGARRFFPGVPGFGQRQRARNGAWYPNLCRNHIRRPIALIGQTDCTLGFRRHRTDEESLWAPWPAARSLQGARVAFRSIRMGEHIAPQFLPLQGQDRLGLEC